VSGQTFKCDDIAEIMPAEEKVKEGCDAFKTVLEAMKGFGRKEIIEY